jgi:hypothetical protein
MGKQYLSVHEVCLLFPINFVFVLYSEQQSNSSIIQTVPQPVGDTESPSYPYPPSSPQIKDPNLLSVSSPGMSSAYSTSVRKPAEGDIETLQEIKKRKIRRKNTEEHTNCFFNIFYLFFCYYFCKISAVTDDDIPGLIFTLL